MEGAFGVGSKKPAPEEDRKEENGEYDDQKVEKKEEKRKDGKTIDIMVSTPGGFADSAAQD